ncbi:hypothetical protein JW926_07415 [Candidatus Sumerlaeota bacterium]|nr:hypothetical protein [Candidatus Sumerlaeota bacterium]
MSFFKAFRILVVFLVITGGLLSTLQGKEQKAKLIIGDEPAAATKVATPVVAKDAATTKTPALKSVPPGDIVSAIMYSKEPKRRMILLGEEVLKIGDKSSKFPEMTIIDIKPQSVMVKDKGKEKELFLKK